MKTGNPILDKALQAQKGIGEIEIVKASFYENPISYGELKGIKPHLVNYDHINFLLKDYEAAYNHWNKAIGILKKIGDPSKDHYQHQLDKLEEQMFWLHEKGTETRYLNGMIKDMVIYRSGNYEAAPGAQQKINEVYSLGSGWYKLFVEKIEQVFISALYHIPLKDTRPLVEKLSPIINQFQPKQVELFANGINDHVKPGINLLALEINILMQLSSDTLQQYFTNEEDEAMLRELRVQLEQARQELENKNTDLATKDAQLHDKDVIIEDLNNTIHDLQQAQGNDIRVVDLTHRLEIVTIQKETAERTVIDRDREITRLVDAVTGLRDDKHSLQQDKNDLRDDKQALTIEKTALVQEKIKLTGDIATFVSEIEEKDHRIEELSTQCQDYVGIMGACQQCMEAIQH